VSDPFSLQRFVDAQSQTYDQALAELRAGQKRTHWMWFVFPQVAGLGRSGMAQRFAISGLDEPAAVMGSVDAMKLKSSMTLFALAAPDEPVFREVLDHYFGGELDEATTSRV
jgi:uncharacterized protein (DUF1810 family)